MGSDLFISIAVRHAVGGKCDPKVWGTLFTGRSTWLAKGPVVDAFGDCDPDSPVAKLPGYLSHEEILRRQEHEECPYHLDEPYWVREMDGKEFVAILRERRWGQLQDGDWTHLDAGVELRGYGVMVEWLIAQGVDVRITCWHSQ